MRKVIQIDAGYDSSGDEVLTVLCDDGTIWQRVNPWNQNTNWDLVPNVPQDEV